MPALGEVFGITRDLPMNYTRREAVDGRFEDTLGRGKHIVIYGSSKQGKTSLRKKCLAEGSYDAIHCFNRWTLRDIHAAILKKAGFEVTEATTRNAAGRARLSLKILEIEAGLDRTVTKAPLEIDVEDVNDVIRALKEISYEKLIVLEDFHYLPAETQKDFSVALKAFHENSTHCFVIVGVWLEENRLTVYNGDLTGRVAAINADVWTDAELTNVLTSGAELMNLRFNDGFVRDLLNACQASVHIVQEVAYEACRTSGISETLNERREVGAEIDVAQLVRNVVNQQSGRYNSFLTQFADGFQDTQLHMFRWILYPVLLSDSSKLEEGIRLNEIRKTINERHPDSPVNAGNVTQALKSVADLQVKKDIKPIILDYDQTNLRLNVVDRGFIIWLTNQETAALLEMVELPAA